MTYNLCHSCASSPQTIVIPAPVHYAHLAAKRARIHISTQGVQNVIDHQNPQTTRGRGWSSRGGRAARINTTTKDQAIKYITIHKNLNGQMYFI